MRFRVVIPSVLLGVGIGAVLSARGMIEVVAGAYGCSTEEVCQQIDWYLNGPEDMHEW